MPGCCNLWNCFIIEPTMSESSVTEEGFKPEPDLPLNLSQLRWKLGRKAKQEPKFRVRADSAALLSQDAKPTALSATGGAFAVSGPEVPGADLPVAVNSLRMLWAERSSVSRMR